MALKWFLNKDTIAVTKEIFDDKALFLLGGKASSVLESEPQTEIPFVTNVTVAKDDLIYAFGEDMISYEYDPPYTIDDSFGTMRFRGMKTNRIYTFFGIQPVSKSDFTGPITDRIENARFSDAQGAEPTIPALGKCTSTTLGIVIYDSNFVLVNPLLLVDDQSIFTKPEGPQIKSPADIGRFNDKGIVVTSNVPYFLNTTQVSLFGNVILQPPKTVPAVDPATVGAQSNPANQNATSTRATELSTQEHGQQPVQAVTPQNRIASRHPTQGVQNKSAAAQL